MLDAGNATTQNLNRIKGLGNTLVIGGDSDTVLVSSNSGRTFAAAAAAPGLANITAVEVISPLLFWLGDSAGVVLHSETLGNSWVTSTMPAAATAIQDIAFVTDEIGFVLAANATPRSLLFASINGGQLWGQAGATWRLNNYPDADQGNRLAYPQVANLSVAANNLLIGGLADDGTDGFVTEAVTNLV